MGNSPDEKPLQGVSFVTHATRGVLRDQTARRKVMLGLLLVAFLLLVSGSTFLAPWLNPREHLGWALFFWLSCVWLTLTALLLALLDLLLVTAQARRERRRLREEFNPGSPGARPSE